MMHVINLIAIGNFASALTFRCLDPVLPQIGNEMGVDMHTVAALTTAFALPYALIQPTLGAMGDLFGKTRIMIVCLVLLALSCLAAAIATNFEYLFAARIAMGAAGGGVFPLTLALAGDLVPVNERQAAVGRLLAANMTGMLMGSAIAGVIADILGWRMVMIVLAVLISMVMMTMFIVLRKVQLTLSQPATFAGLVAGYRDIFRNARTWIVYPSVLIEGICVHGFFPFVAALFAANGETRASIAGVVIAAFSIGGLAYSISIKKILTVLRVNSLMVMGGVVAALALVAAGQNLHWLWMLGVYFALGAGFYALHGSLQIFGSELAPKARGSAIALFATCFFFGQAVGPFFYGSGMASIGVSWTTLIAGLVMAFVGLVAARTLWHAPSPDIERASAT